MSLLKVAGTTAASGQLYVDSVFSTWLYTGNGSTQTITNGIDLAGKGGMVWLKGRSGTYGTDAHSLSDTARGVGKVLCSNLTQAEFTNSDAWAPSSFNSNGWSISGNYAMNNNATNYASWTFRKAAKFFDVVTYTGTGTNNRSIDHNLGITPGMIIVKRTDNVGDWYVYHRGVDTTAYAWFMVLNTTQAKAGAPAVWDLPPTDVNFTTQSGTTNISGATYVAYLFAHDTSSTGIIQCGSYTGNGSATGPTVSLGWEPQYLMVKNASGTGNWQILDSMRGMPVGSADATLQANLSNAESSVEYLSPTATGFQITSTSTEVNTSGSTYIYMAIRRPNKPPTSGTQVFSPIVSAAAAGTTLTTNFAIDMQMMAYRAGAIENSSIVDRLRGVSSTTTEISKSLRTSSTVAETVSPLLSQLWNNTGFNLPTGISGGSDIFWSFKRAPGFFDVVCYAGNAGSNTQSHNLGVTPELIIIKGRSTGTGGAAEWNTPYNFTGTGLDLMYISRTDAKNTYTWAASGTLSGAPTSTTFPLNSACTNTNTNAVTYVAYLFATLAGISKVGSYTGNGTGQAIACGFAGGARFVLIKRTDSTGDWYVWDTARGIVSGNDPHLSLNTTAAEVTTDDSIDPYSAGFAVNQVAATNINVSSATYIFLAIA